MPKLKQPTPLQNIAMDVLVSFLTSICDQLSVEDNLDKLRQVVADIKSEICSNIPRLSVAEFYKKFFEEFDNLGELRLNLRPDEHQRAVLELIMDTEVAGLRCEGPIMAYFDPKDAERFEGLRLLDLSFFCYPLPINLNNFELHDLTTFIYVDNCTDKNLKVIGLNCPYLVYIDVTNSKAVTDRGLRHLNPCAKLRFVVIAFCRMYHSGVTEMLSVNTKIENLSAWTNSKEDGFDCFSHPDLEVYESISKFTIVLNRVSDEHLSSVVFKFPNITSFGISGYLVGDLCILRSLSNLSRLDFSNASGFSWDNLKRLLTLIGGKILDLRMCCASKSTSCVTQSDLDFLFQNCVGIEYLEFDYRARFQREKLAIPPFKKLKDLECRIPREYRRRKATLEFGKMLGLENLLIDRFHITANTIESMLLDNEKFPNLKLMKISEISGRHDGIDNITEMAKKNNLDFEILGF